MEVETRKWFIEWSVQFEEDQLYDAPPSKEQEGINTLPPIFYDDDLLHVSYSYEEDQDQHDHVIEVEPHKILDPNPTPIPNQRTKPIWAQKNIEEIGNGAWNLEDRRRTRS